MSEGTFLTGHVVTYLPQWCDSLPVCGPRSVAGSRRCPAGSALERVRAGSILAPSGGPAAAEPTGPPLRPGADANTQMQEEEEEKKPLRAVQTHTYPLPVLAPPLAFLLLLQLVHLSFELDAPFPRQLHLPPHFLKLPTRLEACQQDSFTERQQKRAGLKLEKNPVSTPERQLSKRKDLWLPQIIRHETVQQNDLDCPTVSETCPSVRRLPSGQPLLMRSGNVPSM